MIDVIELKKAIAILKPNGQVFEVRVIHKNKRVSSGYFTSADTLLSALNRIDLTGSNVYFTLNRVNPVCYDRVQRDSFEQNVTTTSDNDIVGYQWLMVDLDPKRPAGTSSSDEEIAKAKDLGNRVFQFMRDIGFEKPLFAMSGNGVHLLYKVRLANTQDNKKLIERCLKTLALLFSDDDVDVDTSTYNPARVCKLYGTVAQKGSSSKSRPHRASKILSDVDVNSTDIKYLEKLAGMYPTETEAPQRYNNYHPGGFDIESWMDKYGLRYRKQAFTDGDKYILDCCPFDSSHRGKDAAIFKTRSGAIGFHCFHNSCSDKTWRDVRLLYEPTAYEKRQMDYEKQMYNTYNRNKVVEPKHIEEKEDVPVFFTMDDIINLKRDPEVFVRTGIKVIDKRLRGLKKNFVTVVSGVRGSAKSTFLSQVALDAVNEGNNVGFFSGELAPKNFARWMLLQAAGKGFVEPSMYEGYYNVPRKYQIEIANWLGNKFFLYNNEYGNDFCAVSEQFEKRIEDKKLDLVILDNLMAFDVRSLSENKFDAQTMFINELQRIAKKYNVHIVFVAHPRKAMGFLRLDDISGSADLANAVDNAFIVHRNNRDFRRLSAQMFGFKDDNPIYESTNVIEIAKDRDGGTQDLFVPLWYEVETKRLKNDATENKSYGWKEDDYGFSDINEETPWG